MKKITAFVLSVLFVLAAAVPAFAEDTGIPRAEATFHYPKAGDKIEYSQLAVGNSEEYTAEIYSVYYFDKDTNVVHPEAGETYLEGICYRMRIRFTAKPGYVLTEDCEFLVNGEKQTGYVGKNLAEISFIVAADGSIDPATGKPFDQNTGEEDPGEETELSLFGRIIEFFRNLFEKTAQFFNSLFPKV